MSRLISYKNYQNILNKIPILCVDLIIVDKKSRNLLVKRKNDPKKNRWWVLGGRVFKNEKLVEAVYRKAKEEANIKVDILSCRGYYEDFFRMPLNKGTHAVSIVFSCLFKGRDGDIRLDNQSAGWKWSKTLPKDFKINFFKQ